MDEEKLKRMKEHNYQIKMIGAKKIREAYPNVKKICIKTIGISGSSDGHTTRHDYTLDESCLNVVLLKCPNGSCTEIGIDISEEIYKMVSSGMTTLSGQVKCEGYEDAERYGRHRCLSVVNYEIEIEYLKRNP